MLREIHTFYEIILVRYGLLTEDFARLLSSALLIDDDENIHHQVHQQNRSVQAVSPPLVK